MPAAPRRLSYGSYLQVDRLLSCQAPESLKTGTPAHDEMAPRDMSAGDWTGHFSRFRDATPGRINLAAHSHHDWPDATFAAQGMAWMDAAIRDVLRLRFGVALSMADVEEALDRMAGLA